MSGKQARWAQSVSYAISAMALDSYLEVAALDRSIVPGDGARDSRAWRDTGHRVTLINDKDEGSERDGHGQDDVLELLREEASDADHDFLREGSVC